MVEQKFQPFGGYRLIITKEEEQTRHLGTTAVKKLFDFLATSSLDLPN